MNRKTLSPLVLTLIVVLLGACTSPEESDNGNVLADARLLGPWEDEDGDQIEFLDDSSFVEVNDIGFIRGTYEVFAPDSIRMRLPRSLYFSNAYTVDDGRFIVHRGQLGDKTYTRLTGDALAKYEKWRPDRMQSLANRELAQAIDEADLSAVQQALAAGADAGAAPRTGMGAPPMLFRAIDVSHLKPIEHRAEIVQMLLEHGADPDTTYGGRSVLGYALERFSRMPPFLRQPSPHWNADQHRSLSRGKEIAEQRQQILAVLVEHGASVQPQGLQEQLLRAVRNTAETERASDRTYEPEYFDHLAYLERTLESLP